MAQKYIFIAISFYRNIVSRVNSVKKIRFSNSRNHKKCRQVFFDIQKGCLPKIFGHEKQKLTKLSSTDCSRFYSTDIGCELPKRRMAKQP